MALSSVTITYDIADLVGVDFDARRTKVYVTTNVESVIDTVGNKIRVGDGMGSLAADGTGSISVWVPGTGSNPATWQTYVHIDYAPRSPGAKRETLTYGPFTITTAGDLADLVADQVAIPTATAAEWAAAADASADSAASSAGTAASSANASATSATASATSATAAQTARTGAEAAAALAEDISNIATPDALVETLIENPASLTSAALSATIDTARVPAIGKAGPRTGHQHPSGLYLHDEQGISRRLNNWLSRARAGREAFRIGLWTDSIWTGYGAYPDAHSPYYGEFRPPIIFRDALRSIYGMPVLMGVRFTDTIRDPDDTVSYPVGSQSDWVHQGGFGPGGWSGLRALNDETRVQVELTEADPFDQIKVHYLTVHPGVDQIAYTVDGGSETTINCTASYANHILTIDVDLKTDHVIKFGMPATEASGWPVIIGIEVARSTNDYISITGSHKGGSQTFSYLPGASYESQYLYLADRLKPHLWMTNLCVNDAAAQDGIEQVLPTGYAANLQALVTQATANGSDGVALLLSTTPSKIPTSPSLGTYAEKLYDVADAMPERVMVSDLYDEWGEWTNFPDANNDSQLVDSNWFDGFHPARGVIHNMVGHALRWTQLTDVARGDRRQVKASSLIRKSGNLTLTGDTTWLPVHADCFLEVDCQLGEAVEVYLGAAGIPTSGAHYITLDAALVDANNDPIRWLSHDTPTITPGSPGNAYGPWFIGPTADYDSRISGSLMGYPRPGDLVDGRARVGLFFTAFHGQTAELNGNGTFPLHMSLRNVGASAPPAQI